MRLSFLLVAAMAWSSAIDLSGGFADAKGLSNRNPGHELLRHPAHAQKRTNCKPKQHIKKSVPKSKTTSSKKKVAPTHHVAAAKATTSTRKATTTTKRKSTHTSTKSTASAAKVSTAKSTAKSTSKASSSALIAGKAPPKSPYGSCFKLTATAFQPNWKGEATTTWCGVNFDKTSPIIALPLADLSKAYGSSKLVTYYSNETLWRQMIGDWCGREVILEGPSGQVKAYFGDANTWSSVDLNMNVFTKLKGVPTGTYDDPDAAGWMNNINGCFTGEQISIKSGYPFAY